ncbi:hypothetical protein UM654_00415 [Staphylococcus aureus]|nr:hypothetical protein UM654_00415 [Staphylococcus aureus]
MATSCEFDFTRDGKLNVSFCIILIGEFRVWDKWREHYYMYKKFGNLA